MGGGAGLLIGLLACASARPQPGAAANAGGQAQKPPESAGVAPTLRAPTSAAPTSRERSSATPPSGVVTHEAPPRGDAVLAGGRAPKTLFPRSSTPWLGVELKAVEPKQAGVLLSQVFPHSPAAAAGLRGGDIMLTIDGAVLTDPGDVYSLVVQKRVGDSVPVVFMRNGSSKLVRVELEGTPEAEDRLRLTLVGRPAPEIAGVTTFQGATSALADARGQVVVLEFWASWCGPCRLVSPILDRWQRTYGPQGAEVIGITVDAPATGAEIARKTGMSYTLAHDPEGRATRQYFASQVPMLVLIDKRGLVRDVLIGVSSSRLLQLEKLLQELLAEPA